MRRLVTGVVAALLALTIVVPSVSAAGQASGSCGFTPDSFGLFGISDEQENPTGHTVPALFYQVNYSGVDAPTTLGVLVRFNDELESQVSVATAVAQSPSGSFTGRVGSPALIDPANEGGGVVSPRGQTNHNKSWIGGSATGGGNSNGDRNTDSSRANRRTGQFQSPQIGGGLEPGGYAFYVYTGELRDTPDGRRFFADEKSFLGRFECNVEADK